MQLFAVVSALVASLIMVASASAETILLLPLQAKGKLDAGRIEAALERALADRGVTVIAGKAAQRALDGNADQVTKKCAGRVACLGALARKAKAHKVLASRAAGNAVQFVLVASEGSAALQTTSLQFDTGADVSKVVNEGLARVVPVEEEPALQAVAPVRKAKPIEPVVAPPPPEAPANVPELAPVARPMVDKPATTPRYMLYAGIAVASLGAAGMITGAGFYANARRVASAVTDATRQVDLEQLERRANGDVVVANIGLIAGGAVLALGAALIGTDLFLHSCAQAKLSVSAHGAQGALEVTF